MYWPFIDLTVDMAHVKEVDLSRISTTFKNSNKMQTVSIHHSRENIRWKIAQISSDLSSFSQNKICWQTFKTTVVFPLANKLRSQFPTRTASYISHAASGAIIPVRFCYNKFQTEPHWPSVTTTENSPQKPIRTQEKYYPSDSIKITPVI